MTTNTLPQQVILAGENLFALAARLYGDATLANVIAAANGLADPFPAGTLTLTIPVPNAAPPGGMPVG